MLSEERRQIILQLLDTHGSTTVTDLVDRFNVSEMTARRDLDALERKGLLRRVHGGAVNARGRSYEPPFLSRSAQHQAEKDRISHVAAGLVNNGDSITLDVGTTTLTLAHHLTSKRNLTIITPALSIANLLAEQPGIRLIVSGGILRQGEHSMVGDLAEEAFQHFFVDKLFLGIGGIDLEAGLTEFNLEDALVKKVMLKRAKEIIVVADASKFGQVAFAAVAPLSVVDHIVTDTSLDSAIRTKLEAQNIKVTLA